MVNPYDPPEFIFAVCLACGEWTKIKVTKENSFKGTFSERCTSCNAMRLDPQSSISDRTFDLDRAKRKSLEVKRKIKHRDLL